MLQRAKNAERVFVFSMMSNVLQEANKAECVFVFSVMSNVLQRANNAQCVAKGKQGRAWPGVRHVYKNIHEATVLVCITLCVYFQ